MGGEEWLWLYHGRTIVGHRVIASIRLYIMTWIIVTAFTIALTLQLSVSVVCRCQCVCIRVGVSI